MQNSITKKKIKINFNKTIFFIGLIVCLLVIFGCIMVYSASMYSAQYHFGNSKFFLYKQIIGAVLGFFMLILFSFVDYHILKKFKWILYVFTIILLALVFIPGLGVESYGAKRWLNLLGFSIQPSEIAKFTLVLFLAAYLCDHHENIKSFKTLILPLLIAGSLCILVILEPSMSVTMCLALVTFFMLIVGGISKKHTILFSIPASLAVPALIITEPYRLKRLLAFINPWASPQGEGFQLIQSLYSLGNGGLFGVGLFSSRQKYLFLPFAESDFIFSIIGEEFGFFGVTILIVIFILLVYLLIKVALSAKDRFGALLASGVAFVIAIQTILNIAVVSGSIPPTGLPLPFISAGSTSLVVFMSAIGVVLNISKQSKV